MLEVTSQVEEARLGVDFAEVYRQSKLFMYVLFLLYFLCSILLLIFPLTDIFFRMPSIYAVSAVTEIWPKD